MGFSSHRRAEPGTFQRADGVDYQQVQGVEPGNFLFRRPIYKCALLTSACRLRYGHAMGPLGRAGEKFQACRGCPIGRRHRGADALRPSVLSGALSLMCCRCGRGSTKIVRGRWCASCANRHGEVIRQANAKGTKPVKLKLAERTVRFRIGDAGPAQEVTELSADMGEAVLAVVRAHAGVQILGTLENGQPVDFDADHFVRGKYSFLRKRVAADGIEVIAEVDPSADKPLAPDVAATNAARLAETAAWAATEAAVAPFDAALAAKAQNQFTAEALADVDAIIRASVESHGGHISIFAVVAALNDGGLRMPSGARFRDGFVGRRMEHLGLLQHADRQGGHHAANAIKAEQARAWDSMMRAAVEELLDEDPAMPSTAVAARLNSAGLLTKTGRAWSPENARSLLVRLGLRDAPPPKAKAVAPTAANGNTPAVGGAA